MFTMLLLVALDASIASMAVLFNPSIRVLTAVGAPVELKQLLTPSWQ
jgi:hypothetical protein